MIVFFSRSLLRNTMELIEICSCFCFNKKKKNYFNCDKIMRQISRNVNWHCLGKYISQISAILFKNIFKEYFPCIFPRICTPGQICPIFFLSSDWQFQIFFMLKQNELQHIFSWMLLFWRIIIQWNLTFTFVLVWCLEIRKSLISMVVPIIRNITESAKYSMKCVNNNNRRIEVEKLSLSSSFD